MEFDANVEHLRLAFWQIILTAGPILGTALAVGLTIGILQAATSINEMTLSFVPKLVLVLLALALFSPFIMGTMVDYFEYIFDSHNSFKNLI